MAQVALNFLVCGNGPAYRIGTVNILPSETIDNLRQKVWERKPEWETTLDPGRLTLYRLKTPLSTANKEEFNKVLYELSLGTPGG